VSLLSRLFILVATALLPAIAIESYNQFDLRRLRQSDVQEQALSLAKLAAAQQLAIVDGIHQVLIALSEFAANIFSPPGSAILRFTSSSQT
jgi:hypothetical protein